jgi:hypothetical protein
MNYRWLNDEQPDESGNFVAIIENRAGDRISTFSGKTHREVADKLLESQVQSNRLVGRLIKPDRGRKPLEVNPQELTTDDKFRLAQDLEDPNRSVDAVSEIMDRRLGASAPDVATAVAGMSQEDADRYYRVEAQAFVQECPQYYPVQQNQEALFRELEASGLDLTRNNLAIVFARLQQRGGLVAWPDSVPPNGNGSNHEDTNAQPSATPQARPRNIQSIATGIRSSDATALRPRPSQPVKWSRAQIDAMSRAEFNGHMRDPAFRKAVDEMA